MATQIPMPHNPVCGVAVVDLFAPRQPSWLGVAPRPPQPLSWPRPRKGLELQRVTHALHRRATMSLIAKSSLLLTALRT